MRQPQSSLGIGLSILAFTLAACVGPELGAAPRAETAQPTPVGSSATAPSTSTTTTSTTTTTTTLAVPDAPTVGEGTVCDLFETRIRRRGVVAAESIVEASGIVASLTNPNVFWIHNDSGNGDFLYATDLEGTDLATIEIEGVLGFDWEDIAVGPGPEPGVSYLYVGDIGDNLRLRTTISVIRFPEPDLETEPSLISSVETLRFTFPDGPRDSEALFVDPVTGDLFVITKRQKDGRAVVYRAPADSLGISEPVALEPVAEFQFDEGIFVTAADITSDGAVVALRGYEQVWMWVRSDLEFEETFAGEPCLAPSPEEIQGEALAFIPGSLSYVTISEGSAKPLHLVAGP